MSSSASTSTPDLVRPPSSHPTNLTESTVSMEEIRIIITTPNDNVVAPPPSSGAVPRTFTTDVIPTAVEGQDEEPALSAPIPRRSCLSRLWTSTLSSMVVFFRHIRGMTLKQTLWVGLLIALVMIGNFLQIIMLNFWLVSFPADGAPGNYTAFAVPGILFSLFFLFTFIGYAIVKRPNMKFATHRYGWQLLIGVGFCDTLNSWMATYAASHTSEVLQALFTNLSPLYAVFMSKWILRDPRRYCNGWIVATFALTIVGVLCASLYGLIEFHDTGDGRWWILIFFLSIPFRVLMNVWQSLYMIVYTYDASFVEWQREFFAQARGGAPCRAALSTSKAAGAGIVDPLSAAVRPSVPPSRAPSSVKLAGEDTTRGHKAAVVDNFYYDDEYDNADENERAAMTEELVHAVLETESGAHLVLAAPPPSRSESLGPLASLLHSRPPSPRPPTPLGQFLTPIPGVASWASSFVGRSTGAAAASTLHLPPSAAPTARASPTPPAPAPAAPGGTPLEDDFVEPEEVVSIRYHQGDDTTVKALMLAGETFAQMCFTLCLLPADALPKWGSSPSVAATWWNFLEGVECIFTIRMNFVFGFLYTLGFVFTYIGGAYLNHYSVALCSIVTQLSSPLTALVLVLVPSWNVMEGGDSPWFCSVIAIVLLSAAALIYVVWEDKTDAMKVEGEHRLKMRKLRVRPVVDPAEIAAVRNAMRAVPTT